jgi:hypothetical protein
MCFQYAFSVSIAQGWKKGYGRSSCMHCTHNESYVVPRPARTLLGLVRREIRWYSSGGLLLAEHDGTLFQREVFASPEAKASLRC